MHVRQEHLDVEGEEGEEGEEGGVRTRLYQKTTIKIASRHPDRGAQFQVTIPMIFSILKSVGPEACHCICCDHKPHR